MTGKQRVLHAIAHEATDAVPCDFHSVPSVTRRLYEDLGAQDYRELLRRLGSDMVDIRGVVDPVWVAPFPQTTTSSEGVTLNHLGFMSKLVPTVFGELEEHCGHLLGEAQTLDDLERFRWPSASWFDFSDMTARLAPFADLAVMVSGPSVYQHPAHVRGVDMLLCDMASDPPMANRLLDGYTDFYVDYLSALLAAAGNAVDVVRVADDLGMQDNPLISLSMAREYIFPRVERLADVCHRFGAKLMLHSCGCVHSFVEDIIAIGVDILDPLQPRAAGMDLQSLKERFGSRICLHGSIDTQYTLPRGTPSDVRTEALRNMDLFGKAGGFILAPAHSLQPDVPTANILALYDAVREYNRAR